MAEMDKTDWELRWVKAIKGNFDESDFTPIRLFISDTDDFYNQMYRALISYDGMTDEEIFFSDYKEYEIAGRDISIGCINAYEENSARDLIKRMESALPTALESTGMEMSFAQINIFHDDLSVTHLVPSDSTAEEVLKSAFGSVATYDGKAYRLEPSASRKQVIVPAITDALESYPKE